MFCTQNKAKLHQQKECDYVAKNIFSGFPSHRDVVQYALMDTEEGSELDIIHMTH